MLRGLRELSLMALGGFSLIGGAQSQPSPTKETAVVDSTGNPVTSQSTSTDSLSTRWSKRISRALRQASGFLRSRTRVHSETFDVASVVRSHFDDIVLPLGYRCVLQSRRIVIYQNLLQRIDVIRVQLDDRDGRHLVVEFASTDASHIAPFTLGQVMEAQRLQGASVGADRMSVPDASSLNAVAEQLAQLTRLHASALLGGDELLVARVRRYNNTPAVSDERARRAAGCAWNTGDYAALLVAMAKIQCGYTESDRVRIRHALTHVGAHRKSP